MKKIIPLALVVLALSGCVASPVAQSITDKQRAEFEATCYEAKGTFSGIYSWEVPSCTVKYQYPSAPVRSSL